VSCRVKRPSVDLQLYADVDGSLEALTESLLALNTGTVIFKVAKSMVGAPSGADILFAQATGATIVAFGIEVPPAVESRAASYGVPVLQGKCGTGA
jgi:translation initiation factor IF-2